MMPWPEIPNAIRVTAQGPVPKLLRDLVHERTGIFFDDERIDMMLDKLEPRAIARGCKSYLYYYYILKYDDAGAGEWRRVMDVFSVQETYFWRELDQIQALVNQLVPAWFKQSPTRPFRIWSAACATGEEPFSIVMALNEAGWGHHPIEVIASDASEAALEKARRHLFRDRSFRALPPGLRAKYFERQGEFTLLNPDIAAKVDFYWANLLDLEPFEVTSTVDVIFCRNVFIYFSPSAITQVAEVFSRRLPAGGPLFIGASESLLKLTDQFELEDLGGSFVYRRNSAL
jgi:chemotaxis protein methyltransferase CheR